MSPSIKTLKIDLDTTELVLMTGTTIVLEGTLLLNLQKTTKVKTLQLEFSGRSSVSWVEETAYATRHTTAPHIEHVWPFITHVHKQPATVLGAGQHAFPFRLELPDTLPESLTAAHGHVLYRLTATMTRPGLTAFSTSTVNAETTITLLRRYPPQPTPGSAQGGEGEGYRIVHGPEDKIKYKISLLQNRVPHSAKVPMHVMITSPGSKTLVHVLQVGLWERVVYRAGDGRRRVEMRLIKMQKSEGWPQRTRMGQEAVSATADTPVTWNKVLLFDMPEMGAEMHQCNPSVNLHNGLMKVTHVLRCTILGTDIDGQFKVEKDLDLTVLAFEDRRHPGQDEGEGYHQQQQQQEVGYGEAIDDNSTSRRRRTRTFDPLNELPSYLTSFTTRRVSIGVEDALRATLAGIHLPTYAESEESSQSSSPDMSRSVSPERGIAVF
ncbi:hypothetical protein BGZ94_010445 [Podila epigama]|nr:hypothetical protein BGZ94_010445 [Podila epigama]